MQKYFFQYLFLLKYNIFLIHLLGNPWVERLSHTWNKLTQQNIALYKNFKNIIREHNQTVSLRAHMENPRLQDTKSTKCVPYMYDKNLK